jgi:hypothetical protein
MKTIEINVGQAEVVDDFISEVSAAPSQVSELVLVSPFVQLSGKRSKSGGKLCRLLDAVIAKGGNAMLISDDTPSRRKDFYRAIAANHKLAGKLYVCKDLHAKCGFVTNRVGNQVAFLGSANLTDAGLHKNAEIVLGFKGHACEVQGWRLVGQLRNMIDRIHINSTELHNN